MPSQLQTAHDLGCSALERGDFKEARKHFRNMVKESHKHTEQDQIDALHLLGGICLKEKRYDESEETLTKAAQLSRNASGVSDLDTASILNKLALVFWQGKSDREQAQPLFEEAVRLLEAAMPFSAESEEVELEDVATTFESFALFKEEKEEFEAAEPLYRKALDINLQASGGACSQAVIKSLYYLSGCFEHQGRDGEGDELLSKFLPELNRMARELNDPRVAPLIEAFEKQAAQAADAEKSET